MICYCFQNLNNNNNISLRFTPKWVMDGQKSNISPLQYQCIFSFSKSFLILRTRKILRYTYCTLDVTERIFARNIIQIIIGSHHPLCIVVTHRPLSFFFLVRLSVHPRPCPFKWFLLFNLHLYNTTKP